MAIQTNKVYADVDAAAQGIVAEYNSHPESETFKIVAVIGKATFKLVHPKGNNELIIPHTDLEVEACHLRDRIGRQGIGPKYGEGSFDPQALIKEGPNIMFDCFNNGQQYSKRRAEANRPFANDSYRDPWGEALPD